MRCIPQVALPKGHSLLAKYFPSSMDNIACRSAGDPIYPDSQWTDTLLRHHRRDASWTREYSGREKGDSGTIASLIRDGYEREVDHEIYT